MVVLHQNENVDAALRRLHREVLREKIIETAKNKMYRIKKSVLKADKRRGWAKMKRRRREASRRAK